jgi:hypothetical protein
MDEATKLLRRILDCWSEFGKLPDRNALWNALDDARAYLSRAPAEAPPREPTRAMLDAAAQTGEFSERATRIWQAMYDAAIAEGKP